MAKRLVAFIVVVAVVTVIAFLLMFMKQSANIARKKSDKIMEEFKTVERDLHKTDKGLDSLNKMYFDSLIKANK